jgi:predicted double-glycine peptidase
MKTRTIPAGAIKIPLPDMQQPDNYSCGLCVLSVAHYFGLAPNEFQEPKDKMGTNEVDGTYYGDIVTYANELGMDAEAKKEMTKEELKQLLDEKIPVILSMQAWGDPADYEDPAKQFNGHYIVAIGYDDDDYFYFMDPSVHCRRAYLSWDKLDKRWHENERGTENSNHLGIVCRPNGHSPVHQTVALEIE